MDIDWIRNMIVDGMTKGMPGEMAPMAQREIGAMGWNVLRQDLPFPVAVIRRDRLDANRAWMRSFLARTGMLLCPHGKTSMSPELFVLQMADGAFGMTCATAGHLEVYRAAGVRRVLLANQLVGRANIAQALRHLRDPEFELFCLVDSAEGADLLAAGAQALGLARPVPVLVEVGVEGGRTGVRGRKQALALVAHIAGLPALRIRGVETYESVFPGLAPERVEEQAALLLDRTVDMALELAARLPPDGQPFLVSAGGSDLFDMVARRLAAVPLDRPFLPVLRGGCYLTHDSAHYRRAFDRLRQRSPDMAGEGPGLQAALEVWSVVQSVPEAGLAYCALGKRDISADLDLPVPVAWFRPGRDAEPAPAPPGWRTQRLNDQHLHLATDGQQPRVGDLVAFGMSHPCTTFDKWRCLMIVDANYRVIDAIRTFF